jgi:hypothetical protein
MTMLNKTSVKRKLRIGQSASRTMVNGEMLRRLKLSIYEVVTPREEEGRDHLKGLDADNSIILKWILKKPTEGMGTGFI